jgi:hypothetical protein
MARDDINELSTKCVNGNCDWNGPLESRQNHLNKCENQEIDCPLFLLRCCGGGCTGKHPRNKENGHIKSRASNKKDAEETIRTLASKLKRVVKENEMLHRALPEGFTTSGDDEETEIKQIGVDKNNSEIIVSEWLNGLTQGYTVEHLKDQDEIYYGMSVNGLRHGFGVLETKTFVYKGNFRNHAQTGKGSIFHNDGMKYEGDFLDGNYHGVGVESDEKGRKWQGNFVDNNCDGEIHFSDENDPFSAEIQIYKNGEMVQQL